MSVQLLEVEYAADQEPDDPLDFITLVRARFIVSGTTLARCLQKQMRVLERALQKMKPREILWAVFENDDVFRAIKPGIRNAVARNLLDEFGERAKHLSVDRAEESDLPYTAHVDVKTLSVICEAEFDVMGEDR